MGIYEVSLYFRLLGSWSLCDLITLLVLDKVSSALDITTYGITKQKF